MGPALRFGIASKNQKEVVGAAVIYARQNSRNVVSDVKIKIQEIQASLPEGMKIEPFMIDLNL